MEQMIKTKMAKGMNDTELSPAMKWVKLSNLAHSTKDLGYIDLADKISKQAKAFRIYSDII